MKKSSARGDVEHVMEQQQWNYGKQEEELWEDGTDALWDDFTLFAAICA